MIYILVVLTLVFYFLIKKNADKDDLSIRNKIQEQKGAPRILYLRSFNFDGENLGSDVSQYLNIFSLEVEIVNLFKKSFHLVAVGRPGERVPEIGFDRKYFSNETWQSEVSQLMKESAMIFFRPDTSDAVLWEFEQIIKMGYREKTLICADMGYIGHKNLRKVRYTIFCKKIGDRFGQVLPDFQEHKVWIALNEDNQWVFYRSSINAPVSMRLRTTRVDYM